MSQSMRFNNHASEGSNACMHLSFLADQISPNQQSFLDLLRGDHPSRPETIDFSSTWRRPTSGDLESSTNPKRSSTSNLQTGTHKLINRGRKTISIQRVLTYSQRFYDQLFLGILPASVQESDSNNDDMSFWCRGEEESPLPSPAWSNPPSFGRSSRDTTENGAPSTNRHFQVYGEEDLLSLVDQTQSNSPEVR